MAQPRSSDTQQDPLPQPSRATDLAPWSPIIGLRDEIDRLFSGRELGRWFDQPKLGLAGPIWKQAIGRSKQLDPPRSHKMESQSGFPLPVIVRA